MINNIRFYSTNGETAIDVVMNSDETYSLEKVLFKFDEEEEKTYEIKELSAQLSGKFSDINMASQEAKRLLRLESNN